MAHHAKYNNSAIGHMLAHYNREKGYEDRANINTERTRENYTLTFRDDDLRDKEFIDKRCSECEYRATKATIKMVDVIITLPKDFRGNEERFFENCFQFVGQRYGYENVVGGYVHKDEQQSHIHIPFVPVQHDKERDVDRLIAKEVVNRQDLRTFHKDLERFLEREKTPAHVINGATKDMKEQLREKEHELEFYQREFPLDREQQERLNHYLEQQREIDKQMDRNELEQDRDRDQERDREERGR